MLIKVIASLQVLLLPVYRATIEVCVSILSDARVSDIAIFQILKVQLHTVFYLNFLELRCIHISF